MYRLYANCIPVKGFSRSVIYDIYRNQYYYIPNSLYQLLIDNRFVEDWFKIVNEHDVLQEYVDFLIENKCVFNCPSINSDCFVDLDLSWETPEEVSILNLTFSALSLPLLSDVIDFIRVFHVNNVGIFFKATERELLTLLTSFENTFLVNAELYLLYTDFSTYDFYALISRFPFVSKIVLSQSPFNKVEYLDSSKQVEKCLVLDDVFDSVNRSIVFTINGKVFFEAHNCNVYYNKRFFIDEYGNVSGTLMGSPLGCVKSGKSLLNIDGLKKYWNLKKDDIQHCKVCEHRYMCYDSRLPSEYNGQWIYKTACGYNPYQAKWVCEEGYRDLLQI